MSLCKFCYTTNDTIVQYNGLESDLIYYCTKCVSTQENSWEYTQDDETHHSDLKAIQTFIFNLTRMKKDDEHAACIWPKFPKSSLKLIPKMKKKSMEMENRVKMVNIMEMGDVVEKTSTEMEQSDLDDLTLMGEEVRRYPEILVKKKSILTNTLSIYTFLDKCRKKTIKNNKSLVYTLGWVDLHVFLFQTYSTG